jgi:uncharacterized protein YndB with AHSA1/START domain
MYSATIDITAAPSQVFAALTEPELSKQWQPEAVEINRTEGGLCVGATVRMVVQEFGRRFSVESVIVALEPNARLAYHMTTPMWSGRIEYVIKEKQPSTSVSMLFIPDRPKVKGIVRYIVRAVAVLTRPVMQWRLRSMLAALRRVVEANK